MLAFLIGFVVGNTIGFITGWRVVYLVVRNPKGESC